MPYELVVVGGGSGGFGAALAAARLGVRVLLVEQGECLGGTSTRGGVNCWEPGAGGTGIPYDLYLRLKRLRDAVGIYSFDRHCCFYRPDREPYRFPGGISVIDPSLHYVDTLRRYGPLGMADEAFARKRLHGVPFEPRAMAETMLEMLRETGCCEVRLGTPVVSVDHEGGRVRSVTLAPGEAVAADAFIDGTADGLVCVAAGGEAMVGQDARARFGEPDAPEAPNPRVNGVTLIYRVGKGAVAGVEPLPAGIPEECWWQPHFPAAVMNTYPNGDLNMNTLPTMEGAEFLERGQAGAYAECERRIRAHWHHLQAHYAEFREYELRWVAPTLGVRESRRIVCEYVLNEHDLLAGYSGQRHPDIVALADHAMDTHGAGTGRAGCGEVREPYGIPFRCLVPRGFANLLVASRAAGFSSLAASSCRLSRTMMALGQAAGTAVALAKASGVSPAAVPAEALRRALREQQAQVEWPMPIELERHLLQDVLL